jgi:hypothetical protein
MLKLMKCLLNQARRNKFQINKLALAHYFSQ